MAYLEYTVDGQYFEARLNAVDTFVGRSPDCEIQLLHDPELSRVHCSVQRQNDGSYVLVDEGSKNGTYLNEGRVVKEEKVLQDGDKIRIGHTVMVFRDTDVSRTGQIFTEVENQMKRGEGYHTILGKIVKQKQKQQKS